MTDKPITTEQLRLLFDLPFWQTDKDGLWLEGRDFTWAEIRDAVIYRLAEHGALKAAYDAQVSSANDCIGELRAEVGRLKEQLKNTETWWRNAQNYAARLLKQRDGLYGPLGQWKARAEKAEAELEQARPEVRAFAKLMEVELRKHDDRPGWKGEDPFWLLQRLREEAGELERGLYDHSITVGQEAADVANFAMMIADVSGGLDEQEKAGGRVERKKDTDESGDIFLGAVEKFGDYLHATELTEKEVEELRRHDSMIEADEKLADEIKAGGRNDCATGGGDAKATPGGPMTPSTDASPGPITSEEDEKAFADLWALLEWAWKQGGGYFTNMTDAAYLAHWHLRRRLAGTAKPRVSREQLESALDTYRVPDPFGVFIKVEDVQRFLFRLGIEVKEKP